MHGRCEKPMGVKSVKESLLGSLHAHCCGKKFFVFSDIHPLLFTPGHTNMSTSSGYWIYPIYSRLYCIYIYPNFYTYCRINLYTFKFITIEMLWNPFMSCKDHALLSARGCSIILNKILLPLKSTHMKRFTRFSQKVEEKKKSILIFLWALLYIYRKNFHKQPGNRYIYYKIFSEFSHPVIPILQLKPIIIIYINITLYCIENII